MKQVNAKLHMPIENLKPSEKELLIKYLKKYKNSCMAKKLLLCAYFQNKFTTNYISLTSFLIMSLDDRTLNTDEGLLKAWGLDNYFLIEETFFGFDRDTIIKGTLNDVEAMITEWISEKDFDYNH